MKYMFLASIGPIQGFIASARRTGDLQFGSWLLSELAKAAAKSITDKYGLESLIFPAPESIANLVENTPLSVANKIVAIIDDSPQDVGDAAQTAINSRLHKIKERAYKGMGPIDIKMANKQIDDLVEFFWVTVPYDAQDYMSTRTKLEHAMAARKNTRNFKHADWGSNEPKSSIDGQLESVIPSIKYSQRGDSAAVQEKKAKALYIDYEAKPAEYLSGVDLLKRRGHALLNSSPMENFPSTSHMATLPYLERLDMLPKTSLPKIQKTWDTYITELQSIALSPDLEQIPFTFSPHPILGKYDGSLLFEERLVEMVDVPSLSSTDKAKLQNVKQLLQNFYQEVDDVLGKGRPSPYYALLRADGDYMGKVIDNQKEAKNHRELSRSLDAFAKNVQGIIVKHKGALIYAGGDDVLALMPLHTLLTCAHELASSFYSKLQEKVFETKDGKKPTLSVGIAIVHHLDSLQDSLQLVRVAEETKAKGIHGKNGLAITVSKRSGIDYSVVGSWGKIDTYINQLLPFCIADNIPDGTAYELRNLALRLAVPKDDKQFEMIQKAIQAEAKRIIDRKLAPLTSEKKQEVMDVLGPKLGIEGEKLLSSKAGDIKLVDFTNELLLTQEGTEKVITVKPLVPLQLPDTVQTDFDEKNDDKLWFVGLTEPDKDKPAKDAPRYWNWETFYTWLRYPKSYIYQSASELGHEGPAREQRLHVSIDPKSGAAIDGALFQTSGLEFTHIDKDKPPLTNARRLALAMIIDDAQQPKEGFTGFGGERRVVNWQKSIIDSNYEKNVLQCPTELEKSIINDKACRLILLTPAYFKVGYRPNWIEQPLKGVTPKLKAIAIQRPQVASGWDLERKGPKPARRLAPAGTVLFLSLQGSETAAIQEWIEEIWMRCISDNEQDQRDGFGLAMLGTWSGNQEELQRGEQI